MEKSIFRLLGLNFIPIFMLHLLFLALWITVRSTRIGTDVPILEMITDLFIVPVYLIVINYRYNKKKKSYFFVLNFFIMIISSILGNAMSYFNWGVTTGLLKNPDAETLLIVNTIVTLNIITVFIACLIIQLIFLAKRKTEYKR